MSSLLVNISYISLDHVKLSEFEIALGIGGDGNFGAEFVKPTV